MGYVDKNLTVFRVDPRRLPTLLMVVTALVPLLLCVVFRRDITVITGVPAWFVLTFALGLLSLFLTTRFCKPTPHIQVDLHGILLPRFLAHPIYWTDIRSIETSSSRGRLGEHQDHLVFHLNQPKTMDWRDRQRHRLLGRTPQAAINIPITSSWPIRADDARRRIIETAATIAHLPQSVASDEPTTRYTGRLVQIAITLACAITVPTLTYGFNMGAPRIFAEGLIRYEQGDIVAAIPYLKADARAGDGASAFALGEIFLNGDGVERNLALSTAWFERSAKARNAEGAFRLGEAFRLGLGTPASIEDALYWLTSAAEQGVPKAAYSLSRIYRLGDRVRRDYATAAMWLRRSATKDYPAAAHDLGRLYFEGLGVTQDKGEAIKWYAAAAKMNFLPARYELASVLLDSNIGDRQQAIEHLKSSAQGGYAPAQRRLAQLYLHDPDFAFDPVAAYKWIYLAMRAWPAETRTTIVREKIDIGRYLSTAQMTQAMAQIRAWRPAQD